MSSGAIEPRSELVDLGDIVGSAFGRAAAVLGEHKIEIDLDPDLPMLKVDPVLFEQVLFNLLDNAAKYTPPGTKVSLIARREGAGVRIDILDEGEGIPVGDTERIFDKFYRIQAVDRKRAGTGLGLAICRGFVEAMGGTIVAANRTDRSGAVFTIRLPIAGADENDRGDTEMSAEALPLRILIVDDEPAIRRFLHTSLTAQGYRVIEVADGASALHSIKTNPVDVVVLDLGLPDISGFDIISKLRDEGSVVPIVVLSSRTDEGGKVKALDLGADDYVTKPFGIDELLARIRAALAPSPAATGREADFPLRRPVCRSCPPHRDGRRPRG